MRAYIMLMTTMYENAQIQTCNTRSIIKDSFQTFDFVDIAFLIQIKQLTQ